MKKFRQFFQEKIILSAVMCLLLAAVSVAATYGWYAVNNSAKAYGLELQTEQTTGTGDITVAVVSGGPDIMSGSFTQIELKDGKKAAQVSFPPIEFTNVEKGKIAPGAYGEVKFYITAMAENVHSYAIKVQLQYEPDETGLTTEQQAKIEEIKKIIGDHITVYKTQYRDTNGVVKFKEPLTYYQGNPESQNDGTVATGALESGKEKEAILYWVWNYELTDIPNYQNISRFFPDGSTDEAAKWKAVRQYDEEDTLLGNYLKEGDIKLNIYIEGSGRSVN